MKRIATVVLLFTSGLITALTDCGRNISITEHGVVISTFKKNVIQYQSQNWELRLNAIREINKSIQSSQEELIELVLIVSSRDPHPSVRVESLKGMAEMKSKKTIDRIREMARGDDSINVKWYALKMLTRLRDGASFDIFTKEFGSDDWLIREASIAGILHLSDVISKEKVLPYAIKGLNDPVESVKITTMNYLSIKDIQLYKIIRDIFKSKKESSHPLLNASLVALKGYILDDQTRDDLIDLLGHRNREIRILALRALKKESEMKEMMKQKL